AESRDAARLRPAAGAMFCDPAQPYNSTLSQIVREWKLALRALSRRSRCTCRNVVLTAACATIITPNANWKIAHRAPRRPGRVRNELHGRALGRRYYRHRRWPDVSGSRVARRRYRCTRYLVFDRKPPAG